MLRVMYAFTWGNYADITDNFPNRPLNLLHFSDDDKDIRRMANWLHGVAPGRNYGRHECIRIYDIFLFVMRRRGVIE